ELLAVAGIDLVGPLPREIQAITVFSGGIPVAAQEPENAKALLTFLASPQAAAVKRKTGFLGYALACTACSSTLQPASRSSGRAFSISLWLMPPSQGTKIMAAGATRARYTASCAAPLTISRCVRPRSRAARRTQSTSRGANLQGGK